LVWVKFKGLGNSTNLTWQQSGSYYNKAGTTISNKFINGSIAVNPKIDVVLTEINPTCSKTCVANYQADATGGIAPYTFLWNGKSSQYNFIQTNMCSGSNTITITDARGCKLDSAFSIKGLPGANVKLIVEGNEDTTIYLQNPVLSFRFEEVFPTHVVDPPLWDFGDGDTARSFNPTHTYSRANVDLAKKPYYILKLNIKNENGCDTIIEVTIPIKEADIKIPGVITPNSDGKNDVFMILNEKKNGSGEEIKITNEYQRMELIVFDRWGRKLYDSNNYQSDWTAKGVPDGVYYYKLKAIGFYSTENYKGSLTILGSN
jgi:gliding motility-associated-like protein